MTELDMTPQVETEDFSDELSDEALDRALVGHCNSGAGSSGMCGHACHLE